MKNNKKPSTKEIIITITIVIIIMIVGSLMMWESRNGFPPS